MAWLYQTNLFFRSLLFSIFMSVGIFSYSFFCILACPFPLRYRCKMIAAFTGLILWMLKIICRVDYRIEGLENIPADRVGVVLSKHQSTWETFLLPRLFHEAAMIVKRELLWIPFFGWGLATTHPIAINRQERKSAMEQIILQGKACLEANRWIVVFPEGTRIPYGKIGTYRKGGARLAVATHSPVIPVAHNAGKFWPRRKLIKYPGTIRFVIGPLIETDNKTPDEVLAEAKSWIEETIKKL